MQHTWIHCLKLSNIFRDEGWPQQELATRANIAKNTVRLFEAGQRTPTPNNLAALRRAIEAEGIRLLFDETGAAAGIAGEDARIDLSGSDKKGSS
jgi:transcriptional regulator with XRE-family HTH domain